jgi:hypothetical protein
MSERLERGVQLFMAEKMKKKIWKRWNGSERRLTLPKMAAVTVGALALALTLAACENVASYTQPSLVRVIDASFIAGAVNVYVESSELAGNIAQGSITAYGTLPANSAAAVWVTAATVSKPSAANSLVTSDVTLAGGHQHSVLISDNGSTPTSYTVTVLEDQQIAAASGHSAFRFLNYASSTGAVDVYIIPSDSTLADTKPLVTGLTVGGTASYTLFNSQTCTLVITANGSTTAKWTSSSLALTGGEVRTVLIVNTQLTTNPPVQVFIANDVD